ncbi:MAG: beta-propeller domain-containing protein, partial [Clostridiaceae bacterium]
MFKRNYKKAMDKFTPSEAVDNKIEKIMEKESSKGRFFKPNSPNRYYRGRRLTPALALGLALIILVSLWPLISRGDFQEASDYDYAYNDELAVKVSYKDIYEIFDSNWGGKREGAADYSGGRDDSAKAPLEEATQDNSADKNDGSISQDKGSDPSIDYSKTNIQEEDVDEADIVKTDGRYIYMAVNQKIEVSEAEKGELAHLATIDFSEKGFNIREIYLQGDILAIIGSKYQDVFYKNNESTKILEDRMYPMMEDTVVYYFDVSEPSNPKDLGSTEQNGYYLSSRVVEGSLYLVTNKYYYSEPREEDPRTYIPSYKEGDKESIIEEKDLSIAPGELEASYIVICAFNLESQKCTSSKAILGGGRTVYASKDNIYIAMTKWKEEKENNIITASEETVIIGISLNNGVLGDPITGTVPGYEINQFAMDEHKGYLRIVTTENSETYEEVIYKDGTTARMWKEDN